MLKMKNLVGWPLIILFLFSTCKKNDQDELCSGFTDEVYEYSIYQCTQADSIDCSHKVLESVLLPERYLKCCSTDSLLRSCLVYPFLGTIWAYSTLQYGYERVLANFNGFNELFIRSDVNICLINAYREMDPEDVGDFSKPADIGEFMSRFTFIELTIAQFQLIEKLKANETKMLLEICLDKLSTKSNLSCYGIIGEMSILAIMARVLYSQDYKPFVDQLINIPNLLAFIESADLLGIDNVDEVKQFILNNTGDYLEAIK